jgi:rRNA processing protein Gar1
MAITNAFKQGDPVRVPWGVDEVVGTVVEVYGPPEHRYVLVRVPTRGPAGEVLDETDVSYPENALGPVTAA